MSALLAWLNIARMGLVQASMGAMTVIPITTLPRVMQNELGLLALSAGILVGWYYASQVSRVVVGYASDALGLRTPFIVLGLLVLGLSSVAASWSITIMADNRLLGFAAGLAAYTGVGFGVAASGTSILALVATSIDPRRRAPAATIIWLLMIFGIALAATIGGKAMTPFSFEQLVIVSVWVVAIAFGGGLLMLIGLERRKTAQKTTREPFGVAHVVGAVRTIWHEPATRTFTIFIFVSMVAYNMQELVLETYLGTAFGYDAGESTTISGYHRGAIALGLIVSAVLGRFLLGAPRALVGMTVGGCLLSGAGLGGLALGALNPEGWPIVFNVALFGFANGMFAGGAVASMFGLSGMGKEHREGTRLGAFGLAQATGFGVGLFLGAALLDVASAAAGAMPGFAVVFSVEGVLFVAAALLALRISRGAAAPATPIETRTPRTA
ncbi:MFS transporter [Acuticoccus sp. MNP-M23]|uniref:MFS transporter n=1 Tax=Acuticoccus sp. MNP-M23 TaxID=3072793 RepID=UPI0028162432|nr:MFS transporter [Acuticoccus sp. MNP-M23]WMS42695.1 MFS transporter [Acuticoccus sp. MNP-M23]